MTNMIDALSDEAMNVAMDMTREERARPDAVTVLMDRIEEISARHKQSQARELYQIGSKTNGVLCRQPKHQ